MISENASNWVDRGEAAEPKIAKALRHFFGFDAAIEDAQLRDYADTLVGMVAADASEVQVAAYLGDLEDQLGHNRSPAGQRRLEAIAIWHIAKAALIRDRALRLLNEHVANTDTEHPRLSDLLRERILGMEEPR